jgi:hypothetical protein
MAAIQRTDPVGYTAAIIDRLAAAQREQAHQRAVIEVAKERLEAATNDANTAFRELHEELRRMDVAQSGNFGWEQRVAHFLVALRGNAGVTPSQAPRLGCEMFGCSTDKCSRHPGCGCHDPEPATGVSAPGQQSECPKVPHGQATP